MLLTRELQANWLRTRRGQQLEVATLYSPMLNIRRPVVRVLSQTKGHLPCSACLLTPLRQPLLIGIDDSEAGARQAFEDLTLGGGNRVDTVIVSEVGGRRIQTYRNVGSRELAQIGNIAGLPRPHLDHAKAMVIRQP